MKALLQAVVAGSILLAGAMNQPANAAPQYFAGTDHFYEYVPHVGISWTEAVPAAQSRQLFGVPGHLATLTSEAENAFLVAEFGDELYDSGWLGGWQLQDSIGGQGWQWLTGEEWSYTNWAVDQPNTISPGRYLATWGYGPSLEGRRWRWYNDTNDSGPEFTHGYFVEYPVPEPATLALLALGGLALIRRKTRPMR